MGIVQTVTGPIEASALGRTLVHEHIKVSFAGEELDRRYSCSRADMVEIAVDKLSELVDAGFATFVDPCPMELGRDPELYAEISQRTGMNIVCATGFYMEALGFPAYWRARDPEEIAELYITELTDGIAGSGGIRPGAIKAATGFEVGAAEARALIAAAVAQRESGVAIITHTENSRHGEVQQRIFGENGADLGRVLIGHQDEQAEVGAIRALIKGGTFVGIDRVGYTFMAPDDRRADHVASLVGEGYTDRICLSQDHSCLQTAPRLPVYVSPERREGMAAAKADMEWQMSGRPYTYILSDFVPRLRERGVTQSDVDRMFIDNPRRLLAGC